MKISGVSRSEHTSETHTAFKTEPPLTDEVLECAVEHFIGSHYSDTYSREGDLLVVARFGIVPEEVQRIEQALTNAENLLQKKQAASKSNREELLQERAKKTGLPLVD